MNLVVYRRLPTASCALGGCRAAVSGISETSRGLQYCGRAHVGACGARAPGVRRYLRALSDRGDVDVA